MQPDWLSLSSIFYFRFLASVVSFDFLFRWNSFSFFLFLTNRQSYQIQAIHIIIEGAIAVMLCLECSILQRLYGIYLKSIPLKPHSLTGAEQKTNCNTALGKEHVYNEVNLAVGINVASYHNKTSLNRLIYWNLFSIKSIDRTVNLHTPNYLPKEA